MNTPIRRVTAPFVTLIFLIAATLGMAPAAHAVPITLVGDRATVTFSDAVLAPGETLTIDIEYTDIESGDLSFGFYGGGGYLLDLEFVNGTCTSSVGTAICASGYDKFEGGVTGLPAGTTTASVQVQFTVDPEAPARDYRISTTVGDKNVIPLTPSAAVVTVASPEADIALDLGATAGPILASQITYTVTASNDGPGSVDSASVVVDLPSKTYSVSGLPSNCAYDVSSDRVTCTTATIANGSEFEAEFVANMGLLSLGALNATASRTSSSPNDPNSSNDSTTATCHALTSVLISCP